MIHRLSIKDFAIIRELDLPLKEGLTVITGETGAGKSILVKALSVALGSKALKTDVRSGQERAMVEVETTSSEQEFTLRRLISKGGRIRSFIDDEPMQEAMFRSRVASLADFHGQHEQQYIMDPATHIDFLDSYCGHEETVQKIMVCHQALEQAQKEMESALHRQDEAVNRKELLNFQIHEIEVLNPQLGEDLELGREFRILTHMDELVETVFSLNKSLTEHDHSIYQQLTSALKELEHLSKFDDTLHTFIQSLEQASVSIQDASAGLLQHVETLDHDKSRLRDIEERLHAMEGLKRKYGGSLEAVSDYCQSAGNELSELASLDESINQYEHEIESLTFQYQRLGDQLHKRRLEKKVYLEKAIEKEMADLNMAGARFQVQITTQPSRGNGVTHNGEGVKTGPKGYDRVEFYLSANPGEATKPLQHVASGGEVSRIMLAIKSILKSNDPVDTLIFDEIDAGISGQAAEKVAESLVKLANGKQVICITHLPQIASRADHHLYVRKLQTSESTEVEVTYLEPEPRIRAIAELFSGTSITGESLTSVRKSMDQARG